MFHQYPVLPVKAKGIKKSLIYTSFISKYNLFVDFREKARKQNETLNHNAFYLLLNYMLMYKLNKQFQRKI